MKLYVGVLTLQNNKIMITSDSTTDLSPELIKKHNIVILPLNVILDDKSYTDGVDIDPDFIYQYEKEHHILPKTAATNVAVATDFFKKYVDDGYKIIHFCISSEMSGTYQNCNLAAQEVGNTYVVDTRNLSTGGGLLLLKAAELNEQGAEYEDIIKKVETLVPYVDASFVIDSLEYLYKGGRCSGVAALGANLLKLKPCIEVKNGKMGVGKKYRGKFEVVLKQYVDERLENMDDIDTSRIFITHAGCSKEVVDSIYNHIENIGVFKEILVTRAGCTVSCHCGANTLGVLFFRKSHVE